MIQFSFRNFHILQLLNAFDQQHLPLDLFISLYFRAHKALGSKDRGVIAETIYAMVRWNGLLNYLCKENASWEKKLNLFANFDSAKYQEDQMIAPHIRVSFPEFLFNLIVQSHGFEEGIKICRLCNEPAPTTVRINLLKTTREEMLERWKSSFSVSPCQYSPEGIIFHKKINFFELEEFKAGCFEVQDEGSQLLAKLVQAKPGEQVLDYCAGSGGKTLAFAPTMNNSGQIYLHDIRSRALQESRKRLRRAHIQNAQQIPPDHPYLKKMKKKMDWVLVDVPCSGTGTLRRNPDMKWRFSEETLKGLIGEQRKIFERALSFLSPSGKIVYGTCSILKEENQEQVNHFLKTYDLEVESEFRSLPKSGEMDGFFGVTMKRKDSCIT
jgi:16S rRNA (cytosine967-C5)-methyltransferase